MHRKVSSGLKGCNRMDFIMNFELGQTDIAVVGAGHAGIEAALACARMGFKVILFTMNLDSVGNMPCNPSIGGTGKGHLVFEIDALGGEMGRGADMVTLQNRMLNRGKGPAVHSKRIQADRAKYHTYMKHTLENTENLLLYQAEVCDILLDNGATCGVVTALGAVFRCKAAIICAGTYLGGKVIIGESSVQSGPDGMLPSLGLSENLEKLGIRLMRFKTGTPARVLKSSVDLSILDEQHSDSDVPFSSRTTKEELAERPEIPCHIVYTNEKTHEIIKSNLHRSPLYGGMIKGTGPRYCPSIEDKIVRFADKERHQLFVEPMGLETEELYVQGFSSSLPADVQVQMLHSLKGFENAQIMRHAYAIEYDCIDPTQLKHTLEFKDIPYLYGAGQFNGTSGYEEAAAQGLIAGINAALKLSGKEEFVLRRDESYIGTLIDDLVVKGTNEPYRMMTSRSEYRLLLRQDNADERLTPYGYRLGLISEERYAKFLEKQRRIEAEIQRASKVNIRPCEKLDEITDSIETERVTNTVKLADLLRRPGITYKLLEMLDITREETDEAVMYEAEVKIKYEGYIKKQLSAVKAARRLEGVKLPCDIDYEKIKGLRIEAMQKLSKLRPDTVGEASRISGVSPADVSVLLIYLGIR